MQEQREDHQDDSKKEQGPQGRLGHARDCTYAVAAMEFTALERDILEWIATRANDPAIAAQLRVARPVSREYTGCGSYTTLHVPQDCPRTEHRNSPVHPAIESPALEAGGGAVLFF